jgi:hypothetical protein
MRLIFNNWCTFWAKCANEEVPQFDDIIVDDTSVSEDEFDLIEELLDLFYTKNFTIKKLK